MSTIVAPYPTPEEKPIPLDARWWRFTLVPNTDGNYLMMRCDGENPTWVSWEFFDDCDTLIDAGLDKPSIYRMRILERFRDLGLTTLISSYDSYLDVVAIDQPTPSPIWLPLTSPGDHIHPDDHFINRPIAFPTCREPHENPMPTCTPTRQMALRKRWPRHSATQYNP